MPSPRRRPRAHTPGGILQAERAYFRWGHAWGEPAPRWQKVRRIAGINEYSIDETAARAQWAEFRDEITAEAAPWTPWAAKEWDGAPGDVSPYDHLRVDRP